MVTVALWRSSSVALLVVSSKLVGGDALRFDGFFRHGGLGFCFRDCMSGLQRDLEQESGNAFTMMDRYENDEILSWVKRL